MGVLYSQELADRATAWLARPLTNSPEGKRSAEGLLELATIWAAINRTGLPECLRQCQYSERAATLRKYLTDFSHFQAPELMQDSKYQFAPAYRNESISDERYAKKVTADNLTDEDAEFLLKRGYNHVIIAKSAGETSSESTADTGIKSGPDTKAADALKAEKEAHKAEKKAHAETKKELSEVQKQLAEAQKQLADLADKAQQAAGEVAPDADATK